MSDLPRLIYFDVRGRGEPIRMLLEEVGEAWEERLYTLDEWLAAPPETPFHRLPVYVEGSLEIPETMAILSYLGKKHGLLGTNAHERIRCDVTIEAWRDFAVRLAMVLSPGAETHRKQFFEEQFPKLMTDLAAWYESREAGSDFWAGPLTIADFIVFQQLDDLFLRAPELLEPFRALMAFHDRFAARPRISAWLKSPRRQDGLSYSVLGTKEYAK